MKNRATLVGILLCFLVAGTFLYLIRLWQPNGPEGIYISYRGEYRGERFMSQNFTDLIDSVSAFSGKNVKTFRDIEKSSYYPYSESYSKSCKGSTFILGPGQSKNTDSLKVVIDYKSQDKEKENVIRNWTTSFCKVSLDEKSRTERMLSSYVLGIVSRQKIIKKIRDGFIERQKPIDSDFREISGCASNYSVKPIPTLNMRGDYPRSKIDLKQYVQWLKHIEGIDELRDSWGRQLRYGVNNGQLFFSSAGKDGIWGNGDDILVSKKSDT